MHRVVGETFTEGTPGTPIEAHWLNAVQEEICYVITQRGGLLPYAFFDTKKQLYFAIYEFINTEVDLTFPVEAPAVTTYTQDIIEVTVPTSGVRNRGIMIENNIKQYEQYTAWSTWSNTGNTLTGRSWITEHGGGTQNFSIVAGGQIAGGGYTVNTEKFYNSIWSTDAGWNLITSRCQAGGAGIVNAMMLAGGWNGGLLVSTEKFNGTAWATNAAWNITVTSAQGSCFGIQNAVARTEGISFSKATEKFNGATWVASGNLMNALTAMTGIGVSNAGLSCGGDTGAVVSDTTEKFNGSVWIATGNLNTKRQMLSGAGTQNCALCFGGDTLHAGGGYSDVTEKYNGVSWTVTEVLKTARNGLGGTGTQNSGLSIAGYNGAYIQNTEKFNHSNQIKMFVDVKENFTDNSSKRNYQIETSEQQLAFIVTPPAQILISYINDILFDTKANKLTALTTGLSYLNYGYFIAGGNLNTARDGLAAGGRSLAGISFGGSTGAVSAVTETYNGTVWTAVGNLVVARTYLTGGGMSNSCLSAGGFIAAVTDVTEKWNGTLWTLCNHLLQSRQKLAGAGHQNAFLSFGGDTGGDQSTTELFNGSIWVTQTKGLNAIRNSHAGCGTSFASLCIAGTAGGAIATCEKWNGNAWSYTGSVNTARYGLGAVGFQNYAICACGTTGAVSNVTEKFNGYTWGVMGSLPLTARSYIGMFGFSDKFSITGGNTGAVSNLTHDFIYNRDINELFSTEDCWTGKIETVVTIKKMTY